MPKKKTEETVEETADNVTEIEENTEETVQASGESAAAEAVNATEEKPRKSKKKETNQTEETSIVDSVVETVSAAVETVAEAVSSGVQTIVSAVTGDSGQETKRKSSKRAERIGIVQSDKMMKTVTVRVDRVVKHPVYRKYVKRRKNFMAHDEKGAGVGDKVRIIETRPMSARKRWRVVEIIQKAEK